MQGNDPDGDRLGIAGEAVVRVFELRAGTEFVAFFGDHAADLPGDGVRRELRAAANRYGDTTRSVTGTIINDGLAGIIGAGASAPLAAYLPATVKWLRGRSRKPRLDDATAVMALVRATCEQILGSAPNSLSDAVFDKDADGQWNVTFSYRDLHISAIVEPTGSVVTWKQTTPPSESSRPTG